MRPSVETVLASRRASDGDALLHHAVRGNVRAAANQLRHGSELLESLTRENGLCVIGAEYSLETGIVDFFYGVPNTG